MQMDVELGNDDTEDQQMTNVVHWTMKYLLQDGQSMEMDMTDLSIGVLSGVIRESRGVPKLSAMHMMSIILTHRGEFGFAEAYVRMARDQATVVEHENLIGIEYQ